MTKRVSIGTTETGAKMSNGETQSEVERIAMRTNGDPSIADIMRLTVAVSHDSKRQHAESLGLLGELRSHQEEIHGQLTDLQVAGEKRQSRIETNTKRIGDLEETLAACPEGLARQLEDYHTRMTGEHAAMHAEHMKTDHVHAKRRSDDEADSDHTSEREGAEDQKKQVWLMWLLASNVGRLIIFASGTIIGVLVERAITTGRW
jgi:hypothetical protein